MHVFLAGGSGAIGRRLTPQLVARGHQVTATTTSQDKLDGLRALGAEPVVVDGLDAVGVGVGEAVARTEPDAVIHQMSALAGEPDLRRFDDWFARTNELRTAGTEILLAAARATGVKRFVAQSYTGWPNTREGGPVKTEEDPHDSDPPPAQAKSLAAIRTLERAVLEAPLEGIVLRYGSLYGPGASDGSWSSFGDGSCPSSAPGTVSGHGSTSTTQQRRRWPPSNAAIGASTTSLTTSPFGSRIGFRISPRRPAPSRRVACLYGSAEWSRARSRSRS